MCHQHRNAKRRCVCDIYAPSGDEKSMKSIPELAPVAHHTDIKAQVSYVTNANKNLDTQHDALTDTSWSVS